MDGIHHINLAAIDLNLLVVFDALMAERQVTRAGARIGLSQPATSNALARLRTLFDDELFVRTSTGLQPTPRAIVLEPSIRHVLLQVQAALKKDAPFDPQTTEQVFTLGMSDYGEFVLLPKLMQWIEATAPGIRILVRSSDRQLALKQLDNDEIDLALGVFPEKASWHRSQILFQENFVCVSSCNNSHVQNPITLENYLAASHLIVSPVEDMVGRVDHILAKQNLKRRIVISVPHFLIAPFVVANTDLIVTLAERVARTYATMLNLQIQPLPIPVPGFAFSLLWHTKNDQDPAHLWLREAIVEVC
ncbi:LysR family transcriptional regulator [Kovacikia minuta CCNUW1]|uniref:LysR family transcriptional regulator n=1 Tax=Kovacikia minuta TaxID=2931930 RepID=UPI001CD00E3D|nr:LysR family transcriptional regulator [Kovacikia minuta]UBF27165.1 LysR family transcriptional regulator [Kovacikia minuta CCNUW1]